MYYYFLVTLFLLSSIFANSQDFEGAELKKPEGTEFWLCFMKNHNDINPQDPNNALHLELFVTSNFDANVRIRVKSIGFDEKIFVKAGTVRSLMVDPLAQIKSSEIVEQERAVHIQSDKPVSVYGLNRRKQTTDSFMGLPIDVLGYKYRVVCYNMNNDLLPQLAIVATEDNTLVMITPTAETFGGRPANKPFQVKLNKGDVYQVSAKQKVKVDKRNDLTGSLIESDKKIAVFSGHQCAYVPDNIIACNHLVEQIPPVPSWGRHYYIGALKKRSKYTYRVMADQDSTRIFEDGLLLGTINAGEFIEREVSRSVQVTSNKPVLVAQYSQGFSNGDAIGDPMMLLISPTQQFLTKYRFATPVNGFWEHYVNIVAPTSSIASLKMNGKKVKAELFEPLGKSRYSIAQVRVDFGAYELEGAEPFGMTIYGLGYDKDKFDAYGTIGGQSFVEVAEAKDTLAPIADVKTMGEKIEVTFRDDRREDFGLKSIDIIENTGIKNSRLKLEQGVPQFAVVFERDASISTPDQTYLILRATDIANNVSFFSICYGADPNTGVKRLRFIKGENPDCTPPTSYYIGGFLQTAQNLHSAKFNNTGNIQSSGDFSTGSGAGGFFGFAAGWEVSSDISLYSRLSFDSFSGSLSATDTFLTTYLNQINQRYDSFQEGRQLDYNGLYVSLAVGAEYKIHQYIYLTGGVDMSINVYSGADFSRKIVNPSNYVYENNKRTIFDSNFSGTITSTSTLMFGVFGGVGINMPIWENIHGFGEINYNYKLNSIVNDATWNLSRINILLGAKYYL